LLPHELRIASRTDIKVLQGLISELKQPAPSARIGPISSLEACVHDELQRAESTVARPEGKKKVESLTIPELESLTIYLHQPEESFIRRHVHVILSVSTYDDDGLCDLEPDELLREDHR
jgi:hypothetical protein